MRQAGALDTPHLGDPSLERSSDPPDAPSSESITMKRDGRLSALPVSSPDASCSGRIATIDVAWLAAFAIVGILLILYLTRVGVGVSLDSIAYLTAARNLLAGRGLVATTPLSGILTPMSHFPPLYPLVLAGFGLVGVAPMEGARWLGAVLFGVEILVVGLALLRFGRSRLTAIVGTGILLVSPNLFALHAMAFSEPLFLTLMLGGVFLLALALETRRTLPLAASAALIGISCLARYVGIVFIGVGAVALLAGLEGPTWWRIRKGFNFAAIASLPALALVARNRIIGGSATNRQIHWHPITVDTLVSARYAVQGWLVPPEFPHRVRVSILLVTILILAVVTILGVASSKPRDQRSPRRNPLVLILSILIPSYLGFLMISISFLDGGTPLDDRILSIVYLSTIIVLALTIERRILSSDRPGLFAASIVVLLPLIVICKSAATASWIGRWGDQALQYAGSRWRQSTLVETARSLPPGAPIYSNAPAPIYYLTDRECRSLPMHVDLKSSSVNLIYLKELDSMKNETGAFVVYFSPYEPYGQASLDELRGAIKLRLVRRFSDGELFEIED
jgi:hypothetical protein